MKKSLLVFIIGILFSFTNTFASQSAKFHSGFIYHFAKYIEWPASMKSGSFVIAVVGNSDVTPYLEQLAKSKTIGVQKIVIKKCSSIAEAKGAHIMFLSNSKLSQFSNAKAIAKSGHSLLLTAKNNYAKNGSMINFIEKSGRVQFELNKNATKQAGLIVSNKLLSLATVI